MRRRASGDQRGAVLPLTAIVGMVLVTITAMAVDLGLQRVSRRDMQSLSDVVALDLSRQLDGRTAAQIEASAAWAQARSQSVARNDGTAGAAPTVTAELGTLDGNGDFVVATPATVPTAVRVTAESEVDFNFMPGSGAVGRSAVAAQDSGACFTVGSFAARLGSDTSVNASFLRGLLKQVDPRLDTDVVSYQGLAAASISLSELAAELGAGTMDELVALDKVTLGTFYAAVGRVLSANGDVADATVLQNLSSHISSSTKIDLAGTVGQSDAYLLSVAQGDAAVLSSKVSVLDLVAGSAFLVNGSNLLAVPDASVRLPQLGGLSSSLKVIEGAQIGCGRSGNAAAQTDQVALALAGRLADVTPAGYPALTAKTNVTVKADVAKADATLTDITCGDPSVTRPDGVDVEVASALASVSLSAPVKVTGNVNVLGLGVVTLDLSMDLATARTALPSTSTAQVRVTDSAGYDTPATTGSTVALDTLTGAGASFTGTAKVGALPIPGGLTNALLAPVLTSLRSAVATQVVTALLNPLIVQINAQVLASVSNFTGAKVGGADVYLVERPNCDSPSLRG